MIKSIYTALLVTACTFVGVPLVLAQSEEVAATNTEPAVTETEAPAETTLRERLVSKSLSLAKQKRITNLSANMSNMIDARISRLDTIAHRLERRIVKMEQAGLDVAAATSKVKEAHSKLEVAINVMANIDAQVSAVSSSENPKEAWMVAKATFVEAHKSVKEAKELLKEAITLLRQAKPVTVPEETASLSEETTTAE